MHLKSSYQVAISLVRFPNQNEMALNWKHVMSLHAIAHFRIVFIVTHCHFVVVGETKDKTDAWCA